jgi:hypothetical protein
MHKTYTRENVWGKFMEPRCPLNLSNYGDDGKLMIARAEESQACKSLLFLSYVRVDLFANTEENEG